MNLSPLKLKLLDELLEYLAQSQGGDLKSLMSETEQAEKPGDEAMESPEMQAMEDKMGTEMHDGEDPKGISVEKVSVMGDGDEMSGEEPSDEELEELLRQFGK